MKIQETTSRNKTEKFKNHSVFLLPSKKESQMFQHFAHRQFFVVFPSGWKTFDQQ